MNKILLFFLIIGFSNLETSASNKNVNNAEVFLQELFKEYPNVRDISISNSQDEMYFTIESYKKEISFIAVSKKIDGKWSRPEVVSFSGKDKDLEPFLAPDGLKLFFASNRSTNLNKSKKDMDIWYVERKTKNSEWSKPINVGAPVNTDKDEFYPSITLSGNLYFTAMNDDSKGKEDIYISKFIDGKYTKPTSLGNEINSKTYEFNAFVSPDEKLILFSSFKRPDSYGGTDLYVSQKDKNGKWKQAVNLGEMVNSNKIDYCPFVDFKSNTLYITSERSSLKSKFKKKKTTDEILSEIKNNPNGLSRIFKINNFKELLK